MLREVQVRLVRRWNALMRAQHYLGVRNMYGRWLALLGWHTAALRCAARERWIGWASP